SRAKPEPVPATRVAETEAEDAPLPEPTILNADQVADAIRGLVSEATIALQRQVATITADRDSWKARAEKAEGELDALRDLLGGKR
ncbi:hypothetical protein, partial [Enterococcus casseliflavus]|uniref:hypothetical protein n=1 Tax=Enterococcus casseliflavus TaxID=37734 RepID=UPI003D10966C